MDKLQTTIVVVVTVGLAFLGADRFGRSGPDRELLRQLKEMHEARQELYEQGETGRAQLQPE